MFKRIIDIMLSSIGIIVLSPLLLLTAIAIKLDSNGPIIFKQKRLGLHGENLICINFALCV
jgi:O-antigen biosynthesis protein WbqP